jgi:hypothetical protein
MSKQKNIRRNLTLENLSSPDFLEVDNPAIAEYLYSQNSQLEPSFSPLREDTPDNLISSDPSSPTSPP